MQESTAAITTSEVLQFFPEVELPVLFSEETIQVFSKENPPFPNAMVQTLLVEWEGELDEYTEYVPCAHIDSNEDYHAMVYWKGGLLAYEYILVTIDARSEVAKLISRKVISSTVTEGEVIKKSVASIDSDFIIHVMAGANPLGSDYNAAQSQAFTMEIQTTGDIMFSFVNED